MSESDERCEVTGADTVGVDVTLIDETLRMSPAERLQQNDRMAALVVKLREAFAKREGEWKGNGT